MNQKNDGFQGIWTALITPFLDDGTIDWPSYESLLERQATAGVQGLVICGTTGEAPTLTVQEKLSLIRKARAMVGDRLRIMAGTGGQSTSQSIELSRLATDAGADSLLVVTPPYNKPNQVGLKAHFRAVALACPGVPVCLYHVPGRTAQKLTAEALADLCSISGVHLVKEASADLELFSRAKMLCDAEFLSGDDPTFLASLAIGGQGCISVISNLYPEAMAEIFKAFQKGQASRALELHECLLPVMQQMFCESNPAPLKAALASKGLCKNALRLPLGSVSEESEHSIFASMKKAEERLSF